MPSNQFSFLKFNIYNKNENCMENIENNKFNYLTAIKPIFKYRREWVWLCKCDCGKETNVRISKLKNGNTKSCGCFKNKNIISKSKGNEHRSWKGYKDMSMSFYSRIKQNAKNRGIPFSVSIEYLYDLFNEQEGKCDYTGEYIFLPINVRQLRGEDNENIASLDRIDNDKGYEVGNLHWICKRINFMKHTMQEDYFMSWVKKIYEFKYKEIK